jgi:hypothetical protein
VASWTDIPEYEKILKHIVEEFLSEFELLDLTYFEWNKDDKKEIREHFDKFFKGPEFGKLIAKAVD